MTAQRWPLPSRLLPYDIIQPHDEWRVRGSKAETWYAPWSEDVGLTVAEVEHKAEALGEPGAYEWRGVR